MRVEEVKRQEKVDRDGLAIVFMILGNMLFVTSFLFLNEHRFHPVTSALARGISVTFISYVIARYRGIDLTFPSKYNFKWQNIRNFIIVVRGLVYAWVQFYLPLPIVITLNSASPIFSAIFDKILYGMHLNRAQIAWLIVAFIGVIVTANGKYITFLMNGLSS
jgi:drug/metabolite transporter (DMT)-like permease